MSLTKILIGLVILSAVLIFFASFTGEIYANYSPETGYGNVTDIGNLTNTSFGTVQGYMKDISEKSKSFMDKEWWRPDRYVDIVIVFGDIGSVLLEIPNLLHQMVYNIVIALVGTSEAGKYAADTITLTINLIITIIVVLTVASILLKRGGEL